MKKSIQSILISTVLLLILWLPLHSQDNGIDQDRMNRDLRIMEGTLEELFKIQGISGALLEYGGSFRPAGSIYGTYLPGYGVLLSIPDRTRHTLNIISSSSDENGAGIFVHSPNKKAQPITESTIKERLTEFLINYAPAISQLQPDDYVTVIYGAESVGRGGLPYPQAANVYIHRAFSGNEETEQLPVITLSIQKKELNALRSGRLGESEFKNRIQITTEDRGNNRERLDLAIFSGILESGLKGEENRTLRLTRKPSHFYLDNFGVFYQLEFSLSPRVMLGNLNSNLLNTFRNALGTVQKDMDSLNVRFKSDADRQRFQQVERERMQERMDNLQKELAQQQQDLGKNLESPDSVNVNELLEKRLELIRQLMVDYGHTLSSVGNGQSLLVSVNITGRRVEDIPQRINLQISKSDLELLEKERITRGQAIRNIMEKRY